MDYKTVSEKIIRLGRKLLRKAMENFRKAGVKKIEVIETRFGLIFIRIDEKEMPFFVSRKEREARLKKALTDASLAIELVALGARYLKRDEIEEVIKAIDENKGNIAVEYNLRTIAVIG